MTNNIEGSTKIIVNVIWKLIKKMFFWGLGIAGAILFFSTIRSIIVFILISVLLAYMLLPSVEWLSKKRVFNLNPRTQRLIATILVFVCFIGILIAAVSLIITPLTNEIGEFGKNFKTYTIQLSVFADRVSHLYDKLVPSDIQEIIGRLDYTKLTSRLDIYVQKIWNLTNSSIGFIVELVLIPVLAFYFVLDYRSLTREIYGLVPNDRRREAFRIGRGIGIIMQSYIYGQVILCVIAGVLTGLFLAFVGMPYVIVLAIFAAVTRAIPIIGPVASGIPIILIGFVNSSDFRLPIYLLIFVIVMHFAESKFIMPKLIGSRMHLHPALVIIVLLVGAQFFGLAGMFLAAPVAAVIRELVRFYYIHPHSRKVILDGEKDLIQMENNS